MLLSRCDNALVRILRAPGMALQGLTTNEPDDSMLEAALAAFVAVLTPEQRAENVPEDYRLPTEIEEEPELEVEFIDLETGEPLEVEDGEDMPSEDAELEIELFEYEDNDADEAL